MFSGIVQEVGKVLEVKDMPHGKSFVIETSETFSSGIKVGASVAVNGVCLTLRQAEQDGYSMQRLSFDVIWETLEKTTLGLLKSDTHVDIKSDTHVNLERSLAFGSEIGGHLVSGHVHGTGEIVEFDLLRAKKILKIRCSDFFEKYLLEKGFIALDGMSLTLVDIIKAEDGNGCFFTIHLIPETLEKTTIGAKKKGDFVNLEIDSQTKTIVDTIYRLKKTL